jgi:protein-disulfide isomerase
MFSNDDKSVAGLQGSPKTMFLLGLSVGVGSMAVLALFFMMSMFLGGKGGTLLATNGGSNNTGTVVQPTPTPSPTQPTNFPPAADPAPVTGEDHIRGNVNAKVTLIEYSDFECPFCLRHLDTLDQLLATYPNDVRLVYRHFPLSFHPEAQKAAEASECAADQGKFWEMHDKIFEANAGGDMGVDKWKQVASELGLNTNQFNTCLDSGEKADEVNADLQEGSLAGIGGTPGTFVNGQLIEGAVPFATFKQVVEAAGASS